MAISNINRIIHILTNAFKALSVEAPMADCERIAMLIHQSMDHGRRVYHTSSHLFDLCEGMNPRQTLAALFHDIVYYQLDNGFPKNAEALLKTVVRIENQSLILAGIAEDDLSLTICAGLFGFKEGDTLPLFDGMNEFLSAVLATRLLQAYLPASDLIAIAACIEATVPFRGVGADGRQFPDRLTDRIRQIALSLRIRFSDDDITRLVTDAVLLANRDVASFSAADPGYFLSTTWLLIEESNTPLNAVGVYSIQEYRSALLRMEKFLRSLNPENIFHHFQNTPDARQIADLHLAARRNIDFALNYIGAKIACIALIEALALVTGGDCPVSMFIGDIGGKQSKPLRVEDFLPPIATGKPVDPDLMRVLEIGRSIKSNNDLTESPLTAYLCRCLGENGMLQASHQAKRMFAGDLTPQAFLDSLEPELVRKVAEACANIAPSRAKALLALDFANLH